MRLDAEPMHVVGKAYMDLPTTYYASYVSLAPQFGFYDYGGAGGPEPSHDARRVRGPGVEALRSC